MVGMERERTARQVADDLVELLAAERALGARKAALIAELADFYGEVPDTSTPGAERLVGSGRDGTPLVAEFFPAELGPLLGVSIPSANAWVADVMDLRHRHPGTWAALQDGRLELWHARTIAARAGAAGLDAEAALWVDERLAPSLGVLPWERVRRKLNGLIVKADAELAALRAERARWQRYVRIRHDGDGMSSVFARLATTDAVLLESALDVLVKQSVLDGATDEADALRADALASLVVPTDRTGELPRPTSSVVVHIAPGSDLARAEGDLGPLLLDAVRDLLQHHRVRLFPVIDLAGDPQADSYEVPEAMWRQVVVRDPHEVWPFSSRRSRASDLDHTVPWRDDGGPGQTRPSNLGPLGRRAHRVKTHGAWEVAQPEPGVFRFTSPLGYRYRVDRHGSHRPDEGDDEIGRVIECLVN